MIFNSVVSKLFKFIKITLTYVSIESTNYKILFKLLKKYNIITGLVFVIVILLPFI